MSSPGEEEHGSFVFYEDHARHYRPLAQAQRQLLDREIEEHVTGAKAAEEAYMNALNEHILLAIEDMNADKAEIISSPKMNTPSLFAVPKQAIDQCEALFDDYSRISAHLLEAQQSVNVSCGWEGDAQMVQAILEKGRDLTEMLTLKILGAGDRKTSEEMDRPLNEEDERVAAVLELEMGSVEQTNRKTLHSTLKGAGKGIARMSEGLI